MCPPWRRMARAAAWAQKKAPRRFRSRWSAYCAGVARRNGVRAKTAALLTRTSRRPRRRTASRTSARASRGSARLARSATARAPAASSSRTRPLASRAERWQPIATSRPARASASAIARPTRRAPPVMSARGRGGVILDSIMSSRVQNWFKVRFIAGFFFTVPVFLTAWLLWIFWSRIDDVFAPMFDKIFGRAVPALGFLTAVAIILVMGTIARNVVGRRVLAWGDTLLMRVPIYRRLHPSIKMLIDSFSPERRTAFGAVVLVEHPRQGEDAFAFITSQVLVRTPDRKRALANLFIPNNNVYLVDIFL